MAKQTEEMSRRRTLELALEYVTKDRNVDNGDPEDNFGNIAYLMNWWIKQRYHARFELSSTDVAVFSMFIKVARLIGNIYKEDNWIDIAGYAACGAETAGIQLASEQQADKGVTIHMVTGSQEAESKDLKTILDGYGTKLFYGDVDNV